jgi:hypothetical protein
LRAFAEIAYVVAPLSFGVQLRSVCTDMPMMLFRKRIFRLLTHRFDDARRLGTVRAVTMS